MNGEKNHYAYQTLLFEVLLSKRHHKVLSQMLVSEGVIFCSVGGVVLEYLRYGSFPKMYR